MRLPTVDVIAPLAVAAAVTVPALAANVHRVSVGSKGLTFDPSTVFAPVGDTVQFVFYPTNFSVVEGIADAPCAPLNGGFFSGYVASASGAGATFFEVPITRSEPTFFYSSRGNDCASGMVGVINPSGAGTLEAYQSAAAALASATAAPSTGSATATAPPLPFAPGPVGGALISSGETISATGVLIGSASLDSTATGTMGVVSSFTDAAGGVIVTTLPGGAAATMMMTDSDGMTSMMTMTGTDTMMDMDMSMTTTASQDAAASTAAPAGGSGAVSGTGTATPSGVVGGQGGDRGAGAGGTAGSAGSGGALTASQTSTGLAPALRAQGGGEVAGVAGLVVGLAAYLV